MSHSTGFFRKFREDGESGHFGIPFFEKNMEDIQANPWNLHAGENGTSVHVSVRNRGTPLCNSPEFTQASGSQDIVPQERVGRAEKVEETKPVLESKELKFLEFKRHLKT